MTDLGIPQCAVCGKPVDEFKVIFDDVARTRRYTARCHGMEQTVRITDEMLVDTIVPPALGLAFEFRQIENKIDA